MKLQVRYRSHHNADADNATSSDHVKFARLPLAVVKVLYEEAMASLLATQHQQQQQPNSNNSYSEYWSILSVPSSELIDFLPLKITTSREVVYTSYNGGTTSLGEENVIELHSSLFFSDKMKHASVCDVVIIPFITNASRIRVDPCSIEDWELLECFSSQLEDGGLLSQISVVYPNQIIPISLSSSTSHMAHVRILDDDCFSSNINNDKCLRLVQETNVEIISHPRINNNDENSDWSQPVQICPTQSDESKSTKQIVENLFQIMTTTTDDNDTTTNWCCWSQHYGKQQQQQINTNRNAVVSIHPTTLLLYIPDGSNVYHENLIYYRAKMRESHFGSNTKTAADNNTVVTTVDVLLDNALPVGFVALPTFLRYKLGFGLLTSYVQLTLLNVNNNNSNTEEKQRLHHNTQNPCASIKLPCEWNNNNYFYKESLWRIPSNAVIVLPSGVEEATTICNKNASNQPLVIVPMSDQLFYMMPTVHTSIIGVEKIVIRALSHLFSEKSGFLIYGEEGTGKTHACLIIANLLRQFCCFHTMYMDCKKLRLNGNNLVFILNELTAIFQDAAGNDRASLIILDDLDFLTPNVFDYDDEDENNRSSSLQQQGQNSPLFIHQVKVISDHLRFLWNEYRCEDFDNDEINNSDIKRGIRVICTCKDKQSLHHSLCCSNKFFDTCVGLSTRINDGRARCGILHHMLLLQIKQQDTYNTQVTKRIEEWLISQRLEIEQYTDGYRPSDLLTISCRIIKQLHDGDDVKHRNRHQFCWKRIIQDFIPLSLRCNSSVMNHRLTIRHGGTATTTTTWSDVGGLYKAKETLEESILRPIRFHRIYSKCPALKLPRGILMYGPSGCGKTWIVSALANKCNLNLIVVKGPELLNKYIGASEAKVRSLFQQAYAASPSLLFFDDFDALAPKRGSDNTGVTDRVVNQLLTFLDGVETSATSCFIVAATSRPDKIDSALLRPGRLDRHIYIGLPETHDEINDIFSTIARNYPLDTRSKQCVENGLMKMMLSNKSGNSVEHNKFAYFSPADFKAVLTTAYLEAVDSQLMLSTDDGTNNGKKLDSNSILIREENLVNALEQTKPSMSSADHALFENIYQRFMRYETRDEAASSSSTRNSKKASSWDKEDRVFNKLETALR